MGGWSGGVGVSAVKVLWAPATPKKCFRVTELDGARGDPGVLLFSKMNKLFYWHSLWCGFDFFSQ